MARERERYLGAGMDDCLAKPIDWDELNNALSKIAGGGTPGPSLPRRAAGHAQLIDERAIEALKRMASNEELAVLIGTGMSGYEAACAAVEDERATPQVLVQQAHKVRGSSGTLGLTGIAALAAQIEEAASRGESARELVPRLRPTIAATREELVRRGLLRA
jgi:HPt (histidine-containing phosphotransfer) domain-containing protein